MGPKARAGPRRPGAACTAEDGTTEHACCRPSDTTHASPLCLSEAQPLGNFSLVGTTEGAAVRHGGPGSSQQEELLESRLPPLCSGSRTLVQTPCPPAPTVFWTCSGANLSAPGPNSGEHVTMSPLPRLLGSSEGLPGAKDAETQGSRQRPRARLV